MGNIIDSDKIPMLLRLYNYISKSNWGDGLFKG